MGKKKRIISYILSIFLVIFLFITILLTTLNCTILSKLNVKKKVAESNYYAELQKIIVESSQNYVMQSGFDESIMDGVVNVYDVQYDVDGLIDYIYEGKEYVVQSNMIRANLDKNIKEYVEANDYEISEENQKGIDEFENAIEDIYKRNIMYSEETIKQIAHVVGIIKKVTPIAMIVCAIISIVLALITKETSSPAIGISMLSTGALFVFLKTYSGTNVAINNILLLNKAFSNTLIAMANQLIQKLYTVGVILCIAGVAFIIYAEAKKKVVRVKLLEEHSQIIR